MRIDRSARGYWLLVLPLVLLVVGLYCWPIINILLLSVTDPTPGLENYAALLSNPGIARIIWTTLRICSISTAVSVVAGYLLAYVMSHVGNGRRNRMLAFVMLSFWISVLVRTFAWLILLGRTGLVNSGLMAIGMVDEPVAFMRSEPGVLIGMIHYMIPYAALPLLANMQGIDARIADASRSLGAGAFYTFRRIYLPLTVPGITAASLIVFIISLGFFITPAVLGGGKVLMIAEYVSVQILVTLKWGLASMLATLLLAGIFGLLFALSRLVRPSDAINAQT